MTAHRRAADRERQGGRALGVERVKRGCYESAPDLPPVVLPCGVEIQAEVKTRRRLPVLVTKAIKQAKSYAPPGAVPVAILSETGGPALIVLPLKSFRVIAGLEAAPEGPPPAQTEIAYPDLGDDERAVLAAIAGRLAMGRRQYGPLDVTGDARCWRQEAAEEAFDLSVYLACEMLRLARTRQSLGADVCKLDTHTGGGTR